MFSCDLKLVIYTQFVNFVMSILNDDDEEDEDAAGKTGGYRR